MSGGKSALKLTSTVPARRRGKAQPADYDKEVPRSSINWCRMLVVRKVNMLLLYIIYTYMI